MKNVAILGSTGSIGTQALSFIEENEGFNVTAMCCHSSFETFLEQVQRFRPKYVSMEKKEDADRLYLAVKDKIPDIEMGYGMEGMCACASYPENHIVLTAVVGMIGIRPTVAAIEAGFDIALANKETLVCAGDIIMEMARKKEVHIYPVDSEHSAIFQSLQGYPNKIKKIILTASGGPFFGKTREELSNVTVEDALKHPNWSMGAKITVDSSTLVNKGLETIEACHLFNVGPEDIEILVHRQSILHSGVEFVDGALIGQMGVPDMKLPIAYALSYPKRLPAPAGLSLSDIGTLTFEKPDIDTFRGLGLCIEAAKMGGNMPAVMNAANEIAVGRFLKKEIGFLEIPEYIERAMDKIEFVARPELEYLLDVYALVHSLI